MRLFSLDDGSDQGAAAAQLSGGELLVLAHARAPGTLETWLPGDLRSILDGGAEALDLVCRIVERTNGLDDEALAALRARGAIRPSDAPLLAPIPVPRMVLAVGLAYKSHLEEMSGTPTPKHPTAFLKAPSSVCGPGARLRLPPQAPAHVDYEGEFACVFGRECHDVEEADALSCLAGYTAAIDYSARDWVYDAWAATEPWEARQTWERNIMGKQLPGFTALGPSLTTLDEAPDIGGLRLTTTINGTKMQSATLDDMIFPLAEVISYFSRWYTFRPGDVLLTGTPAGVGVGRKPPVFIADGDEVTVSIDRIGALTTRF